MTMEERSSGIEDGAPAISTGGTSSSASNLKSKASELSSDASYPLQRASKRSFDVAFLVAPDEKMMKRQTEKLMSNLQFCTSRLMSDVIRQQEHSLPISDEYNEDSRDYEHSDRIPQNMTIKHFESIEAASSKYKLRRAEDPQPAIPAYVSPKRHRLTPALSPEPQAHLYVGSALRAHTSPSPPSLFQRTTPRKLFADENSSDRPIEQGLPLARAKIASCDSLSCPDRLQPDSRSAFTKVNLPVQRSSLNYDDGGGGGGGGTASPRSSVSPDVLTYQNSLSPPIGPASSFSPAKYSPSFPSKMPYPFLMSPESQQSALLDNLKLSQQLSASAAAAAAASGQPSPPKVPSPSGSSPGFRAELPAAAVYPNLAYNPLSGVFPPAIDALARPASRFLAAGLLPSSFAALALPAQNVCAKCNLSFRMTSDLVYHMRSHHKNESAAEAARRRREEKLRCPVCDESFRERHHLTRHMTAHQDKESDAVVDQVEIKRRTAAATLVHGK